MKVEDIQSIKIEAHSVIGAVRWYRRNEIIDRDKNPEEFRDLTRNLQGLKEGGPISVHELVKREEPKKEESKKDTPKKTKTKKETPKKSTKKDTSSKETEAKKGQKKE